MQQNLEQRRNHLEATGKEVGHASVYRSAQIIHVYYRVLAVGIWLIYFEYMSLSFLFFFHCRDLQIDTNLLTQRRGSLVLCKQQQILQCILYLYCLSTHFLLQVWWWTLMLFFCKGSLLTVTVKAVAYCIQHIPMQPFAVKGEYDLIYLQVCVCAQYSFFPPPFL